MVKSSTHITLQPGFPYTLVGLLAVAHLGAAVILWLLVLPALVTGAALLLLLVNILWVTKRLPGIPMANNVCRLTWNNEGRWWLETFGGSRVECDLQGPGFVHPWLVILRFQITKPGGRRHSAVVLFPDALDRETLRRLRVRLNVEGNKPSQVDVS